MSTGPLRGGMFGRLALEGAVVVASILLAFAIDAAWDGRQALTREISYLTLLAADLTSTLEINERVSSESEAIDLAGAKLARAYFESDPPPLDSVVHWLSRVGERRFAGPQLGTARSLAQGGNLDLIRDDSVRSGIPRYLRSMELYERFEERTLADWDMALQELSQHLDLDLARLAVLPQEARDSIAAVDPLAEFPAGPIQGVRVVGFDVLVMQDEVHRILARLNRDKAGAARLRRRMREVSENLLAQVHEAMGARIGRGL